MSDNHSIQSKKSIQKELKRDKGIIKKFMEKYGAEWQKLSENYCDNC